MLRYLDPKYDIPFKKVFEHKAILISFLNALLPIEKPVVEIEYLSPESVPETPLGKFSSVDVRCTDSAGRFFIVEMQLFWSMLFARHIVFNASKALVKQMDKILPFDKPKPFSALNPVYTLAIINAAFSQKDGKRWYYHYKIADVAKPDNTLEGLEFVIVDLENFKREDAINLLGDWDMQKKRLAVAWLHFFKDIISCSKSADVQEIDEIQAAINLCERGAYTRKELDQYDSQETRLIDEATVVEYENIIIQQELALAEKDTALAEKDTALAEKDTALAEQKTLIESLMRKLAMTSPE